MQEQTSSWFWAPSRLLSKAINAASYTARGICNVASAGTVAALTVGTQIVGATGQAFSCFNVPGNSQPYLLDCSSVTSVSTLTSALESNGTGITAAQFYQCAETFYENIKGYGSTAFGWSNCDLFWNGNLNSVVDSILGKNALTGVWSSGSVLLVVFFAMGGTTALCVTACCIFGRRKSTTKPTETTALTKDNDNNHGTVAEY